MHSGKVELDRKCGTDPFPAFEADVAVVIQNDVLCISQAETGPPGLAGKIGFKDL